MPATEGLIQRMLDALQDETQVVKRLSTWECDFLESIQAQWERTARLSEKQVEILERIYSEKTA